MYSTSAVANTITADFRSDTVTRPTPAMREAMSRADLGDDVYGDDPTVNALEEKTASLLGKEAALFMTSGTQSNLAAVMAHCARGEEFLIGTSYHIRIDEALGTAILGGVAHDALPVDENGALAEDDIRAAVKSRDDVHEPITRLLCIENTTFGKVLTADYMDSMAAVARECNLRLHCDGARLMNAAVALGVAPEKLVAGCDSVSLCLSKGLGAPAGTMLAADAATIKSAKRLRKMLGGGMRQTGILAAAGIHALDHHVERLGDDHARAITLAKKISALDGITVDMAKVQSNMVYAKFDRPNGLSSFLATRGIAINPPDRGGTARFVTHLDIDDAACDLLTESLAAFTSGG